LGAGEDRKGERKGTGGRRTGVAASGDGIRGRKENEEARGEGKRGAKRR
jgi:hypothetical protein